MQVIDTAAHFEEVEGIVHEFFSSDARNEWSVVDGTAVEPSQSRGDGGARVFVFEMKLHKRSEPEAHARLVGFRECFAQDTVEQESGFEVGAGGTVFNCADAIAQVQLLRALFDGTEQALEATTQVGGLADVGLGGGILATQEEDGWGDRNAREYVGIPVRGEFDALGQHTSILAELAHRFG
ncbi:MAG: hypothetical protein DMG78_21780 [Acidobacteria bacterium]|nr:MAG: hypothetical protein DMG78_21780 [Acidobacteriota bacterium]